MTSKDPNASNSALLYLIYQHLKENGYQKAANVLKKHVTQIETPEEITSLHAIYTSWTKVSEIGQNPKQEPEVDSTTLKKIKADPSTKEDVDSKPIDPLPPAPHTPQAATPENEELVPQDEKLSSTPVSNGTVETSAPVPAVTPLKPAESSDSDSESEEEIPFTQGATVTPKASSAVPTTTPSKPADGDSQSDSENEIPPSQTVVTPSKAAAPTESSDSDDSDTEEEVTVKKPALTPKAAPVKPAKPSPAAPVKPSVVTPSQAKAAPKTPAAGKKAQSSDSDSS
ncbi:unnamed protein product, partial [Coregonus sp. 'balchen']